MFADNHRYREYQQLLVELHFLIAAGRNQSAEAQEIRNLMEQAEAWLSVEEIVRLNALSADLAMLHDREIPDPDIASRTPAAELPRLLESTFEMKKWEEFLELLRAGVSHLWPADQIAYVRSRAYEELSEFAPAVAFMEEAARRSPSNANYRALALHLLWKSGHHEKAYERAREHLQDRSSKPRLVLIAGGIVAQRAMQPVEPTDLDRVAAVAVPRLQQALTQESSPNLTFAGLVSLGLLALQLNDHTAAESSFANALQVETTSDQQVTSSWALTQELALLRSGKAKTPEERFNARQLIEIVKPSGLAVAA